VRRCRAVTRPFAGDRVRLARLRLSLCGVAVFAGEHGLDVIRPLIEQAHVALKPGGWLAVEIGYSMRDAVLALFDPTMWDEPMVVPDLQGIPRVIAARKR